jgi:hypothetical protein
MYLNYGGCAHPKSADLVSVFHFDTDYSHQPNLSLRLRQEIGSEMGTSPQQTENVVGVTMDCSRLAEMQPPDTRVLMASKQQFLNSVQDCFDYTTTEYKDLVTSLSIFSHLKLVGGCAV